MRIITCFGDRTCSTFLIIASVSNSVSRTDNFESVFNSVTSPRVLSHRCIFLTISVGFNFNLTFGLKPQVIGIKVTVYKRSIFQVEWLI